MVLYIRSKTEKIVETLSKAETMRCIKAIWYTIFLC